MNVIRILLCDDHAIVRQGLRALFSTTPDLCVVGEADRGDTVVALVQALDPDVCVLDLSLPGLHGVAAAEQLRACAPRTRIVVLSMHAEDEFVRPAIRAGIAGYLVKGADLDELVAAVRSVAAGGAYFSASVSHWAPGSGQPTTATDPQLTAREREVLQAVADGHTSLQIGDILGISAKTVEVHRANLMSKLGVRDVASLVRVAIRRGLIAA